MSRMKVENTGLMTNLMLVSANTSSLLWGAT